MSTVDEIQRDLACPQCDYNLRGLPGAVVMCPECGQVCDIARMIANRWTQPWFSAPGLSTIYGPTAWTALAGMVVAPVLLIPRVGNEWRMITVIAFLGFWAALMQKAWSVFRSPEGIKLALVSHAIFAGYIAAVAFVFGGLAWLINAVSNERGVTGLLIALSGLVILPGIGAWLIWICRRGEKYIGERCIRRYLNRPLNS